VKRNKPDDPVDQALSQSFPASDPPGGIGMTAGSPSQADRQREAEQRLFDPFDGDGLHARIARHWWAMALKGVATIVLGLIGFAFRLRLRSRDISYHTGTASDAVRNPS
jgi:hypothetical protein